EPDVVSGLRISIGSRAIGVLRLVLEESIDARLRSLWLVATMLIVFAVILAMADTWGKQLKPMRRLNWRDGILYGLAQALALIPGVSRSGGTITMGLALGYTRQAAARYAFLLAVPAVCSLWVSLWVALANRLLAALFYWQFLLFWPRVSISFPRRSRALSPQLPMVWVKPSLHPLWHSFSVMPLWLGCCASFLATH